MPRNAMIGGLRRLTPLRWKAWRRPVWCWPSVTPWSTGLAYTDRLRLAGVPVRLELYRGLTHDFIKMGRALPEAVAAQTMISELLAQALCP